MQAIVVSASNSGYFPLLRDLVQSLRDKPESDGLAIGVLDLGLSAEEIAWIRSRNGEVVKPGWDVDLGKQKSAGEPYKAQVNRPFLRKHFPGHETYIWMDADTWVQDWWAMDLLLRGAAKGALAIVPEVDRCFTHPSTELSVDKVLGFPYRVSSYHYKRYKSIYGKDVAWRMNDKPVLNCGVFALGHDAPHWDAWARELQAGLHRTSRQGLDQTSLNYLVYILDYPAERLPARVNWTAHRALPRIDETRRQFVEPYLPNDPVGVLHLTLATKDGQHDIETLGGDRVRASLRYPGPEGIRAAAQA